MDDIKIAGIIKVEKINSFKKKLTGYKRANIFLSNFSPEEYHNIEVAISYFQKLNSKDWNYVLNKFENDDVLA